MMWKQSILGIAAIAAAATLAACGGGSTSAPTTASPSSSAPTGTVDMASTGLGDILVNSGGRTLYLFEKDTGTSSTCSGNCAIDWPPLTASADPTVGNGVNAAKVGTTTRSDGTKQVTYNGHPLYFFKGDARSGDTNGQAVDAYGALWYVVSPAGNSIVQQRSTGGGY
jgi:predicted lipoprotein with Yx(FWY)xxD motif